MIVLLASQPVLMTTPLFHQSRIENPDFEDDWDLENTGGAHLHSLRILDRYQPLCVLLRHRRPGHTSWIPEYMGGSLSERKLLLQALWFEILFGILQSYHEGSECTFACFFV